MDDSFEAKYNRLILFYHRLNEFKKFTPQTLKTKSKKKKIVYNNALNLCNKLLSIYFNDYNNITNEKKEQMNKKYDPNNLLIKGYKFIDSKKVDEEKSKSQPEETIAERVKLIRQKADDKDLTDTSSLEGDDNSDRRRCRSKRKERIKTLDSKQIINQTSNIISTSTSWKHFLYKLKNEIRQIHISTIKSLITI